MLQWRHLSGCSCRKAEVTWPRGLWQTLFYLLQDAAVCGLRSPQSEFWVEVMTFGKTKIQPPNLLSFDSFCKIEEITVKQKVTKNHCSVSILSYHASFWQLLYVVTCISFVNKVKSDIVKNKSPYKNGILPSIQFGAVVQALTGEVVLGDRPWAHGQLAHGGASAQSEQEGAFLDLASVSSYARHWGPSDGLWGLWRDVRKPRCQSVWPEMRVISFEMRSSVFSPVVF